MTTHDALVSALEHRFDFVSARVVAKEAKQAAGLDDREAYSEEDLRRLAGSLPLREPELERVLQQLGLAEPATA